MNKNNTPTLSYRQKPLSHSLDLQITPTTLVMCFGLLFSCYAVLTGYSLDNVKSTLMGIGGAIVANSTGAGGGVVFMPVFHQWQLNTQQALATSIAIQCFGMTAGSLTWLYYFKNNPQNPEIATWGNFSRLLLVTTAPSILGVLVAQYTALPSIASTEMIFSALSVFFGFLILYFQRFKPAGRQTPRTRIQRRDYLALAAIGFVGGIITAWISVGVGELVVLYLLARRFPIKTAIATAVCCSALTVITAVNYHAIFTDNIIMDILIYAAPGAIIGGTLARLLANAIPASLLKISLGLWILLSGLVVLLQIHFP